MNLTIDVPDHICKCDKSYNILPRKLNEDISKSRGITCLLVGRLYMILRYQFSLISI
jgi:hypothetical protein